MINLRHFIEAKKIKFVHKIINSEPEHWNIIGKYWLSSFDQRYDSENFLLRCSNIKKIDLTFKPNYIAKWEAICNINIDWKKNNGHIHEKRHSLAVTLKNNFIGK